MSYEYIDRIEVGSNKYWLNPGNAGSHNGIYRGISLGTSVTADQWAAISAGTFDDLYIGDYWTINDIIWRIAAFDYWYNFGNTACNVHHAVIVPDSVLAAGIKMNSTNTTEGAYYGSDYYTGNNSNTGKSQCATKITSAFGSSHILSHKEYLKNAVTNGYESAGAWYDSTFELMTEQMVYGGKIFGNGINGTTVPASYTIDYIQLPLFALNRSCVSIRENWWLRDVSSASQFATISSAGTAYSSNASYDSFGIRPAFGIK